MRPELLALGAAASWAVWALGLRWATERMAPAAVVAVAVGVEALGALGWLAVAGPGPERAGLGGLVGAAVAGLGGLLGFQLFGWALRTGPDRTAVLTALAWSSPTLVALGAWVCFGEPPTGRQLLALGLLGAGAVLGARP